jgi:hypothetical protein
LFVCKIRTQLSDWEDKKTKNNPTDDAYYQYNSTKISNNASDIPGVLKGAY